MNQKGMSLIEVVVSLAIMSIIVVMVFQFVQIGLNTSTNSKTVANVQTEAQTTVNQLKDWIMETNKGIVCYESNSGNYDKVVAIYNKDVETNQAGESVETGEVQLIFYRKNDNCLYYDKVAIVKTGPQETKFLGTKDEIDALAGTITAKGAWKDYLFSQYVKEFQLDISKIMQQKVSLIIEYENKGKTYEVNNLIKLRNVPEENPAEYGR